MSGDPPLQSETTQFAILLFTDICDSTALKSKHGALAYKAAAELHNALFERLAAEEGLTIIKNSGDGYLARTTSYAAAVWFALRFQHGMRVMQWPSFALTTRVGIHAGEVAHITTLGQPDLLAPAVDLVARVMSLAVGGQILLTRSPYDEARNFIREHPDTGESQRPNLAWLSHGWYGFKGADEPIEVFELGADGFAPLHPPPDGEKAWRVSKDKGDKKRAVTEASPITKLQRKTQFGTRIAIASLAVLICLGAVTFFLTKKAGDIDERLKRAVLTERALAAYQDRFRHWHEQNKELPNKTLDEVVRAELPDILRTDAATVKTILDEEAPRLAAALDTPIEKKLAALFVMGRYETVLEEGEKRIAQPALASLQTMGDAARALFANTPDKKHLEDAIRYYTGAAALVDKDKAVLKWAEIQFWKGRLLSDLARYKESEAVWREVTEIRKRELGESSSEYARALHNLVNVLQATNRLAEAEPLMRRTLAIYEVTFGDRHPWVARALDNLGCLLHETNRSAEAEPMMRRALAIDEATFGDKSPVVAIDLNSLADLLDDTKRFAEAEPLMRRALAIDVASLGDGHPTVAGDFINLARLLKEPAQLAEAETLSRRALAMDEASYGANHPKVARDLNNLAQLLHDTNRLDEAEPLMRRALAIDQAVFGDSHRNVAIELNNLAALLQDTKRLEEAEPMFRRALAINEASFGDRHPKVATCLNNLARLLRDTKRLAEAEPLMRRALAIEEASLGDKHPNVVKDLTLLARLLQDTKRPTEAEPLMRRALAIDEASYGDKHPNVATRLINLAQVLKDANRLAEAEPLMRRALAINEAAYGDSHENVARSLFNLARLLQDAKRLAEAEPLMRRALEIAEKTLGPEHTNTIQVKKTLELLRKEIGK